MSTAKAEAATMTGKMSTAAATIVEAAAATKDIDSMSTGKHAFEDGSTYEGEWKGNLPHGFGTGKWEYGSIQYTGDWHEGTMHGNGKLVDFNQQTIKTGTFENDLFLGGRGTLEHIDGEWKISPYGNLEFHPDGLKGCITVKKKKLVEQTDLWTAMTRSYYPVSERMPNSGGGVEAAVAETAAATTTETDKSEKETTVAEVLTRIHWCHIEKTEEGFEHEYCNCCGNDVTQGFCQC